MSKTSLSRHILFCMACLSVLWSCSGRVIKPEHVRQPVIFPSPPDTARIQFLTSISSSIDITGQRSSFMRYVMGEDPGKPIHKPYGIEIYKEKIYICDTMLPGLEIIDLQKHTFEYFTPKGFGQLKKPLNCAIDKKGRLYIADVARKQVILFDKKGTYVSTIGDKALSKPTDVLIYQNKIWICDLSAHQVKVFDDSSHQLLFSFPEDVSKNSPRYLFSPTNINVYKQKIYVTDTGDARIKVFDTNGTWLKSIGSYGKRPGQFVRPKGLALNNEGHLFAVDAAFENVQIFNNQDRLLMFFGKTKGPGQMWLPAGITIDYGNLDYFQKYVYPEFELKYLIFVTNQYGPARLNVYGFIQVK